MTLERYARHALIDWFDQDLIRSLRTLVVGAGALGNEVIKNLALLGVGEIHVFDLDVIEASNLTRSVLFRETDIGRAKAECAAARARELDPEVAVHAHQGDLWKTLSFSLLQSSAVVFGCVDNYEARIRLNRLCALARVPLVNTGIDSRFAVVERFPFDASDRIGCYECDLPPSVYASIAQRYSCGWLRRLAIQERKTPTTILTAAAAGSLAVSGFLRSLVAPDEISEAVRIYNDTFTGHTTRNSIAKMEGCPGCGDLRCDRVILAADRSAVPAFVKRDSLRADSTILFSDRVLTYVRCPECAPPGGGQQIVFRASGDFDESVLACPSCGCRTREVGLADRLEVRELLDEYAGRPWPGKFVMYTDDDLQVVVELLGVDDGRCDCDFEDRGSHTEGGGDGAARSARSGPDPGRGDELVVADGHGLLAGERHAGESDPSGDAALARPGLGQG